MNQDRGADKSLTIVAAVQSRNKKPFFLVWAFHLVPHAAGQLFDFLSLLDDIE
jgi:hypothetical protein